jgi:tripeptidyl-peptidase-1
MHWLSVLSFLAAASIGLATPIASRWDDMTVKHSWGFVPAKWEHCDHPSAKATIDLRVALKPHRENALIDALYEVSDPKHLKCVSFRLYSHAFAFTHGCIYYQRRYGAHLSKEQVADLVAPHPDTLDLVGSWLAHHRVPSSSISITHGGSWLTLSGIPVAQANALLGASYQFYRHTESSETVLRTIGYALPEALHEHVQTVAPTTYFGSPRALRQTSQLRPNGPTLPDGDPELQNELASLSPDGPVPANCSNIITPTCLRILYKTRGYVPRAPDENQLGITGYLEQYVSRSDLKEFMTRFRPDAEDSQVTIVNVNGSINDEDNPGVEARILPLMSVYVSKTCNPTG